MSLDSLTYASVSFCLTCTIFALERELDGDVPGSLREAVVVRRAPDSGVRLL